MRSFSNVLSALLLHATLANIFSAKVEAVLEVPSGMDQGTFLGGHYATYLEFR